MKLSAPQFIDLCRFAAALTRNTPKDLNAFAVYYAIGGVESSFGRFAGCARFEDAFSRNRKGKYAEKALTDLYGDAAACSLGPWQIMFSNAARMVPGITPGQMLDSMALCAVASARFMDYTFSRLKGSDIVAVGDAWNTGNDRDTILPAPKYIADIQGYYRKAIDGTAIREAREPLAEWNQSR